MAIENAKQFLKFVYENPELKKRMVGFSMDELKQAAMETKGSGPLSDDDLDTIAGGGCLICG